jgi:hypothetical protein
MGVYGPYAADSYNATDVEVIRSSSVVSQLEKFGDLGEAPNVVIHARHQHIGCLRICLFAGKKGLFVSSFLS